MFNVALVLVGLRFRWILIIGLASMSHVLLDSVWRSPASFWWPFQGWGFPRTEGVGVWEQVMMHLRDPLTSVRPSHPYLLIAFYPLAI